MLQQLRNLFTSKSWTLAAPSEELRALFGATPTAAGIAVTAETALRVPAVACAVRQIAESVASLPIIVKQVLDNGDTEEVPDHPVAALLNESWNDWTSAYEGKLAVGIDALCRDAGGMAWVNKLDGRPREIIPYAPGTITVTYADTGEPSYALNTTTGQRPLNAADVIHVRPLGRLGKSPVTLAREAIGIAMAQERYAGNLFSSGGRPSGVIHVEGELGPQAYQNLRATWRAAHEGEASGRTAILDNKMKFEPLSFASTDLQFLELQKFQVEQIARAFKVPPHMLYEMGRATWGNAEQLGLEFIAYTLQPWLEVWQGALRRALFSPEERGRYRIEFETDDLTRADIGSRAQAYSSLISSRVINANQARRWEGLSPYDGGEAYVNPNISTTSPTPPKSKTDSRVRRLGAPSARGGPMKIECKAAFEVDDAGAISGIAWPFGSADRMGDMIAPGAFKSVQPPLPMLAFHQPTSPIGAWDSITEKSDGLHVAGRLLIDDVVRAREVRAMVKAGAVRGLSIGFATKQAVSRRGGGRTITALDLVEVSLVSIPMHPGAKVSGVKSAAAAIALADAINRAAAALRV